MPPLLLPQATTQDLEIIQSPGRVRLIFSMPGGEIEWVEIYRGTPAATPGDVTLVARVAPGDLRRDEEKNRFLFEEALAGTPSKWLYRLRFVNRQGRRSEFSNPAHTEPLAAALPPSGLSPEVREDRILVRWNPPRRSSDGAQIAPIEGYLVNSEHVVKDPFFEDRDFRFGEPKTYQVQTISRRQDPLILSDPSDALTVVPRDVFAPAPPRNLSALLWEGKIQLIWDSNEETDLAGYFVYQGRDSTRLEKSSGLVTINSYREEAKFSGNTLYFRVSAVDTSGNESRKSEPVSVTMGP